MWTRTIETITLKMISLALPESNRTENQIKRGKLANRRINTSQTNLLLPLFRYLQLRKSIFITANLPSVGCHERRWDAFFTSNLQSLRTKLRWIGGFTDVVAIQPLGSGLLSRLPTFRLQHSEDVSCSCIAVY
ncbi:hypothetical protein TcasGA2_TC008870 [Tribolium castaneum]|uniref:Uncharacterized protein n=1 Tax=Tribolium castaneum TaxID=7070 RepID=D6WQR1_TRICA|nr:hypothetical protein TcasGA2_TC008870 [Tribolium castaneum]